MRISFIIPVLNEAAMLTDSIKALRAACGPEHEIIVVDGGSADETAALAKSLADQFLISKPGRAVQMNAGVEIAKGDIFLFLHADTVFPKNGVEAILNQIKPGHEVWGRFDVRLSGNKPFFRVIEFMMNWRSRVSGIATGDQAIFISRDLFHRIQGFSHLPLMEDVEICRRLKIIKSPICLSQKVITSSRRWEARGTFKTILLMWRLRLAYWLGVDPATLARQYR
jgi:rSAM/selenodomain-associated transferase 2